MGYNTVHWNFDFEELNKEQLGFKEKVNNDEIFQTQKSHRQKSTGSTNIIPGAEVPDLYQEKKMNIQALESSVSNKNKWSAMVSTSAFPLLKMHAHVRQQNYNRKGLQGKQMTCLGLLKKTNR